MRLRSSKIQRKLRLNSTLVSRHESVIVRAMRLRWLSSLVLLVPLLVAEAASRKDNDLVDLRSVIPGAIFDIRYATTNNFLGQRIYTAPGCFLRRSTAEKLKAVQMELERSGLRLKIFDAYRPLSAQRQLWKLKPDSRYVANPARGSRHNRGAAVDVTLARKDGTELPMGTGYDDFTEQAHRDFGDLPRAVIENRQRLEAIMVKHGFVPLRTEWWHFDDAGWERSELLDVSFEELQKESSALAK